MNPLESGLGKHPVVAQIIVNKGLKLADGTSIEETYVFGGKALNGGYPLKADGSEDKTKPMWRQWNEDGSSNYKMENTVFFVDHAPNGREAEGFDYVVKRIAKSINGLAIAIKKVNNEPQN